MASMSVGSIMKHDHRKVVVLRTGLSVDGADAVMIARLSTRKPSGGAPYVEAKTWVGTYWVPLDQVKVVKAAGVVHACTSPGRLPKDPLKAVLKELSKASR
ncbi:hypothetical protein SAMN05216188_12339 [Lentzea xinjiangensis]|uniref:PemK-like, MazF-like toxin of type II toxin-antitoxin system n=1 Tax=Lentzea xinjiangensis TaxID=402600 RepID=A0A1H9UZW7_9PSEU|nr:hypothetical protein [Lentzea xinjiangensis]SES14597.1 hypothetical protein SAMN05216188_12339 [Lentzea xinjiangensis]